MSDDDAWHDDHDHDDDDGGEDDHDHGHWRLDWFTASVALADGRWLNVAVGPPPGAPALGATFVVIFLLSALGIAAVAVVMGRRIAKPMRGLAAAAGRLGRGEAVEDLSDAGPAETRETVRAFNLMRARLDRYVRGRTAMLAAVSHDLRTPITSLRLHAEFVEDAQTQAKILSALDEMQRMTEDALAFIRDDMQWEETRNVDLHALVDSVAADLLDLGHDIAVADSERVVAACRPASLRRALRNLLHNAAAYGARATVRIDRDDVETRIVIEDEGPGIPECDLNRVFEPFVRLESSRSLDTGRKRARARHRTQHRAWPRRRHRAREPRGGWIAGDGRAARHARPVGAHRRRRAGRGGLPTTLSRRAPPEPVTFLAPGDAVRRRGLATAAVRFNHQPRVGRDNPERHASTPPRSAVALRTTHQNNANSHIIFI